MLHVLQLTCGRLQVDLMALIIGDDKCSRRVAAAGRIHSFETNNGSPGKSNSVSHAPKPPILSYATRIMTRKKYHSQTPLTPPDSTRTSLENTSNVTPLATPDNHVTVWHSHSISPPPSPPLSPLTGTPSLESIIRQIRDVLTGESAVCVISNVSSQLYDELSARARTDGGLAGWDDVRCASQC